MNLIMFSLAFIFSSILTSFIIKIAIKKKLMDIPNQRSSHKTPTPRGGGLAIIITWYLGLIYLFIQDQIDSNLFFALNSGLILGVISFLDDIYNLKPYIRILGQIISTVLALYFIGGVNLIDFGIIKFDNLWIITTVAFFGIIWFINLFNFLDGIDGYAGMEATFISLVLFYFTSGDYYLLLVGSVFGFLIWNWQPAKVFMGDVGSTVLGFNLIIMALYEQNTESLPVVIFLIISSLFWFDATLTLFRRIKNKEKLTEAHKKHAYQRIVQTGISHRKTVVIAILINLLLFLLAYLSSEFENYSVLFIFISIIFLYIVIRKIDLVKPFI